MIDDTDMDVSILVELMISVPINYPPPLLISTPTLFNPLSIMSGISLILY